MAETPLPAYTVRHSKRATRVSLRVLPGRGVEVVLPQGVDPARAHGFVKAKAGWLRKTLRRLEMEQDAPAVLPQSVHLQAVARRWEVRYSHGASPGLQLMENAGCLQFLGTSAHADKQTREHAHCQLLQQWLKQRGRQHLPLLVRELEAQTGLACRAVQVRLQRTRWGSCSSRKTLSLNASLLFLPPTLMRHVLLHELCHTRLLNHSADFWRLLLKVDPHAREHDAMLATAWRHVPGWVHV